MVKFIKPEKLAVAGYIMIISGLGCVITNDILCSNIPYSYRQTPLDVIDYVAGKNVFKRKESLQ